MSVLPVAAIVLAAGKSSRMGEPKQLLRLGDSTLLNRTLANIREAGIADGILVLGANAGAIEPQLPAGHGFTLVHNRDYEQGMASSVRAALAALPESIGAALIVLGDQPFVRAQTLCRIAQHPLHTHILIPVFGGRRGNPVRIARALFPQAMALEGDAGFRTLFASYPQQIELLETDDEGILQDVDSPDDYRRLVKESVPPRTGG